MHLKNSILRFLIRHYPLEKGKTRTATLIKRYVHGLEICFDNFGNRFLLDLDNYIDNDIYIGGSFERKTITLFSELAIKQECHYFVDIGANLGFYSIFFASQSSIERVYAFEPDPRNFAQLLANVFLNNRYEKITPYNLALSSINGEGNFYLSREKKTYECGHMNTGTSSLIFDEERHSSDATLPIQTRRLDDLLEIENQSIAVKMNVDRYEALVLEGMSSFL